MNIETYNFIIGIAGTVIAGLFVLLFWILKLYIAEMRRNNEKQESQNSEFYKLINSIDKTLTRLATNMEADRKLCDERHFKSK